MLSSRKRKRTEINEVQFKTLLALWDQGLKAGKSDREKIWL